MRPLLLAALLLPTPALADDCAGRLRTLLSTDLAANGPYTAMNTNRMAAAKQVYRQTFVSDRHFLVETISPPGQPDTLHYNGGAWNSDGAGSWTLAWQMDADEAAAGIEAQRQAAAQAVQSAICADPGDGTQTLTGTLGPTPHFGAEATVGYVIDGATDTVQQMTYDYVLNGLPVSAQYRISPAPGLSLPFPPGQ
ncbi:hypothetical protein KUL25_11450 [Rhodobacteraceae bacterium N5(2021)]|uniref:Uncharacterized protein n=1 Tax=Gymnodinialimonas phycosphaerae TaxID=2841589 RepID=A0A975YE89_9RHOB|nr:hypothetical protein [Gymnodinialimonas phycosphaerae]MBY4893379.1 hypothetical protein [Gymnodinialimonas phycosphaerae]